MKKIILLCSNGMSTSMMVAKMKEAAKKIGYDCTIAAYALSAAGIPAAPIDMKDYGMMNGVAVLKAARKMMGEEV